MWWSWWSETNNLVRRALTVSIVVLIISWFYFWMIRKKKKEKLLPLPPGPRGLPLVGYLPFLREDLHHLSAKLAKTYGPITKVQLGGNLLIFVTSPKIAKEVLRDCDAILANRFMPTTGRSLTYGGINILFSPNGSNHRMLRKLCVCEVVSTSSLDSLYALRRQEVRRMVERVKERVGSSINVAEEMFLTMFNSITNMLWGGMVKDEESNVSSEFHRVVEQVLELLGSKNISDVFGFLGPLDLQGLDRKMKKLSLWLDGVFDSIIERRMEMNGMKEEMKSKKKEKTDLLQVLLQLKEGGDPKAPFTLSHVKALFVDMIAAGTRTSSATVEWAITEMIQNKNVMAKAQKELAEVVGMENIVEESHMPKLLYLEAVIKEVLRLHPVLPLLVPRCPTESCTVGGFTIPKGSLVLVNAWAIHRDPKIWHNPLEFRPERFLENTGKFDYSGNDFRYIPFGSGRRICIGSPMAERMIFLVLASLLHSFDWRLPEGTTLDFSENFGPAANKAIPLRAIPEPRLFDSKLYS